MIVEIKEWTKYLYFLIVNHMTVYISLELSKIFLLCKENAVGLLLTAR